MFSLTIHADGAYVMYQGADGPCWYFCNDSRVVPVSISEVVGPSYLSPARLYRILNLTLTHKTGQTTLVVTKRDRTGSA